MFSPTYYISRMRDEGVDVPVLARVEALLAAALLPEGFVARTIALRDKLAEDLAAGSMTEAEVVKRLGELAARGTELAGQVETVARERRNELAIRTLTQDGKAIDRAIRRAEEQAHAEVAGARKVLDAAGVFKLAEAAQHSPAAAAAVATRDTANARLARLATLRQALADVGILSAPEPAPAAAEAAPARRRSLIG